MSRGIKVNGIQPSVLKWARESIGLSITDVAKRLKKDEQEIYSWEGDSGDAPTYSQLEKLAYEIYKRPLAVFFLPEPPKEKEHEKEFRTLPESDLKTLLPDTHLQIRKAHAFQLSLQELFDNRNPSELLIWKKIQLAPNKSLKNQALEIRKVLEIDIGKQSSWLDDDRALKEWRQAIEGKGIFIFKSAFKQKEISGFCLNDEVFPIIYLNNSTTKTRQIFSLFHELTHLLLDVNGLSKFGESYFDELPSYQKDMEVFCNAIAAEILIPSDDFGYQTRGWPTIVEELEDNRFAELATRYGVSRESILRRFLDLGRASEKFYKEKAAYWKSQIKEGSGGNWYSSQNVYLSTKFANEVVSRHYNQKISIEQASELLGIKPKNFAGLEEKILRASAN